MEAVSWPSSLVCGRNLSASTVPYTKLDHPYGSSIAWAYNSHSHMYLQTNRKKSCLFCATEIARKRSLLFDIGFHFFCEKSRPELRHDDTRPTAVFLPLSSLPPSSFVLVKTSNCGQITRGNRSGMIGSVGREEKGRGRQRGGMHTTCTVVEAGKDGDSDK